MLTSLRRKLGSFSNAQACLSCLALWFAVASAVRGADDTETRTSSDVLVVVGAGGTSEYALTFAEWAENWRRACETAAAGFHVVGLQDLPTDATDEADREALRALLEQLLTTESPDPLWLVLIGHGTFDGRSAKFNLRGRDVSAGDLAQWLAPAQRPLVVVNCSSASGPFVPLLAGANRVIVAATKSGFEVNYSRFGGYFSQALTDHSADLDKDQQVSLLEAYISAAHRVAEFYESEGRLATEHPILDDNGDGKGTPGDWYRGVRAVRASRDNTPLDGLRARQTLLIRSDSELELSPEARARRDELERQLEALRERKTAIDDDDYYSQLEVLLLEIARLRKPVARPVAGP
jgi:hypothetical protein